MNPNPMHKARAALALHPRCGAHSRTTGQPCKNPSMTNGRCRMHGGRSTGAPRGRKHWNYRHGLRTKEARQDRREARRQILALLDLIRS
jgi:hypothetical protein